MEAFLKERADAKAGPSENWLAQLSCGSPGMALSIDLEESARLRRSCPGICIEPSRHRRKIWPEMFAATAQLAKQRKGIL
jgi:hypothetical protein